MAARHLVNLHALATERLPSQLCVPQPAAGAGTLPAARRAEECEAPCIEARNIAARGPTAGLEDSALSAEQWMEDPLVSARDRTGDQHEERISALKKIPDPVFRRDPSQFLQVEPRTIANDLETGWQGIEVRSRRVENSEQTHAVSSGMELTGHFEGHEPPEGMATQIVGPLRLELLKLTDVIGRHVLHGFARPENRRSFNAVVEAFLSRYLGGRVEPFGRDFEGSTISVPTGGENVPGLRAALPPK